MDEKTRKLMTHKTLHTREDTDKMCVSRKGRRGLARIEDCVDASIQGLEGYIKKRKERLCQSITSLATNYR